jgi:hypothetical protein
MACEANNMKAGILKGMGGRGEMDLEGNGRERGHGS